MKVKYAATDATIFDTANAAVKHEKASLEKIVFQLLETTFGEDKATIDTVAKFLKENRVVLGGVHNRYAALDTFISMHAEPSEPVEPVDVPVPPDKSTTR